MLKRQVTVLMILILLATMALPASAQGPRSATGGLTVPVTSHGIVVGTFTVQRFVALPSSPTGLGAEGKLSVVSGADTLVTSIVWPVQGATTKPASAATAAVTIQQAGVCEILDLTLGPLHLDLAGLVIDLDPVHLLITADPTGGLLGSLLSGLLCGSGGSLLAGLLQNLAANLQQVINILNQILNILG